MKKIIWKWLALMGCLLIAGCANSEETAVAAVEELPIEQEEMAETPELEESYENSIKEVLPEEKEPYEDLEIEVNGNKGTIVVGTTGTPFTELLTQAKIQLAEDGWDLQIEKYEDYQKLNEDVLSGGLDAHLFAHQTYIDSYNDVNLTTLTSSGTICYEVYGVYSKVNQDLTKVSDGAIIGIPTDDTAKARTLLYMQDLGWIVLKEDVGMTAILDDIVENMKNLQFVEYTSDTLEQILEETDYCIIGADQAIVAGFDMEEDMLAKETNMSESSRIFSSLLITKEENVSEEKIQVLVNALKSAETKAYMEEKYKGAYAIMK